MYKIMYYSNYGANTECVQTSKDFEQAKYLCRCYGSRKHPGFGYYIEDEDGNQYNEFGRRV